MKNPQYSYDVVVLGAGLTGCAAAIAAARNGASVLIADSAGYAGGAASTNLIYPYMPNQTKVTKPDGTSEILLFSRGLFAEITNHAVGIASPHRNFYNEDLKLVLDEMMLEAGVKILYHATLCGVEKEGAKIRSISLVSKSGIMKFEGKVFIDCTGDADLCAMAELPTRLGRPEDNLCQPMTLCFRVANIDKAAFFGAREEIQRLYKEWQADGRITNPRENVLMFDYLTDGIVHFNTTRIVKLNPVDPFDLTAAEIESRRQVKELIDFLKANHIPGFDKAELIMTAPAIGVRESRMLDGEYVLTGQDLVDCVKFEDSIAAGNYDIDIHNPAGTGTSHHYFAPGTWYTIPYRSLIPKKADAENLLVGGRCISATHEAQASVRIMPICCNTGEAAGAAAGIAVADSLPVQDIDVKKLQKRLSDAGAYLGI